MNLTKNLQTQYPNPYTVNPGINFPFLELNLAFLTSYLGCFSFCYLGNVCNYLDSAAITAMQPIILCYAVPDISFELSQSLLLPKPIVSFLVFFV